MAPNTTMAQFISAAVGMGYTGKKLKTKEMMRKARAMSLHRAPQRPKDQRRGRRGSPRHRFRRTQPTEAMYEKIRAALETEMMALRATVEPKLMAARMREMARQTLMALTGMSQPGLTWSKEWSA